MLARAVIHRNINDMTSSRQDIKIEPSRQELFHLEKIGNFIFISRILVFNNKIIATISALMKLLVQCDMSTYND